MRGDEKPKPIKDMKALDQQRRKDKEDRKNARYLIVWLILCNMHFYFIYLVIRFVFLQYISPFANLDLKY